MRLGVPGIMTLPPEQSEALLAAHKTMRDGYADAVAGLRYILQMHGRLSGVGFDRVFDHYEAWVTICEREDLLAGSHTIPSAALRARSLALQPGGE